MKLFMVGASPFVRKVRAAAVQVGVDDRIELQIANPHQRPAELVAANPLSKVPTLVDEAGGVHTDSYAICDYLDSLGSAPKLIPLNGDSRQTVLFRHALAHGIMECAVIRRVESLKAVETDRTEWMQRQRRTIERVLDRFETDDALDGPPTLDRLTLGAALGFLDFRFPDDGWRDGRPRLTAWLTAFERIPAMAKTTPFE